MAQNRSVCYQFARSGTCKYGRRCKYAHVTDSQSQPSASRQRGSGPAAKKSKEVHPLTLSLRKWRQDLTHGSYPPEAHTLAIFRDAKALLDSDSSDVQHEVATKLADGEGLSLVRKVSQMPSHQLRPLLLPFLQVLTHSEIVSSLVLEKHVGTIYNILYGVNGVNGIPFFDKVIEVITDVESADADADTATHTGNAHRLLSHALDAFARMIALNQAAVISDGIKKVAHRFQVLGHGLLDEGDCPPRSFLALRAIKSWKQIQVRLEMGQRIPESSDAISDITRRLAQFQIQRDWPGALSQTGARHDNDHADIKQIQILPTAQEILSSLPEYLPSKDPRQRHLSGAWGLLDRQFRLLREDTVGQLRDAIKQAMADTPAVHEKKNHKQGVRTTVFHNATINGSFWSKKLGLLHMVEFDQPANMRRLSASERMRAWSESRDIPVDTCVCLVGRDQQAAFYSVVERDSGSPEVSRGEPLEKSMLGHRVTTLYKHERRAAVAVKLIKSSGAVASEVLARQNRRSNREDLLVEFPGVLLASFSYTLEALQSMSHGHELPFSGIIAPDCDANVDIRAEPPQYAKRVGFAFELSETADDQPLRFVPGQAFDHIAFSTASKLDESQTQAFLHALSSRFALIQGPPGTGKSFVGVKLIQTLLQNKAAADLGPVLCICYTNHALDQILEHLMDKGVDQIIRIGGRSKSEVLANVNLANVSSKMDRTWDEKHFLWRAHSRLEEIETDARLALGKICNADSVPTIRRYLLDNHRSLHDHFFGKESDEDGFKEVRYDPEKAFERWLKGGSRNSDAPIRAHLDVSDTESMSRRERQSLVDSWVREIRQGALNDIKSLDENFVEAKTRLSVCHDELSLRCLRQANVVGVTTTGIAKNINLLKKLGSKVLVVEEAAEVLEAHMLPALLPNLEQVIAIGDHQQLRPQIANYELSVENARGVQHSLDVSLFERLIYPEPGLPSVPFVTLRTQRRMHPSIAKLVRGTIYQDLEDAPSVSEYPDIIGLRRRLYWLDHRSPESADETSKSNDFEVEMVAALVSHIVRQGTYSADRITVLAPYLAQFRKLRRRFSNVFEIEVGDRDKDALAAAGMNEEVTVNARRASLATKLRISTVDNYQGEEADIVVVSLVRSNDSGAVGFLRTSNRINVLLSRARHGMYIIGNSSVARGVTMWKQVIDMFEGDGAIGPKLPLSCPRHPQTAIEVAEPDDFSRFAPEGGCDLTCEQRLKCGHACLNKCHAQYLHDSVVCQNACPRLPKDCAHPCQKICGVPCDEECLAKVKNISLPCGHVAAELRCFESKKLNEIRCRHEVQKQVPYCGHSVAVYCSTDVTSENFRCMAPCGSLLPCGHECGYLCHECNTTNKQGERRKIHPKCKRACAGPRTTCSHHCSRECHGEAPCGPCNEPCALSCVHSKCSKQCSQPCAPCAEACTWSCEHQGSCKLPCSVPCSRLPCSERCSRLLPCGHQCPSICGETCPSQRFCQQCGDDDTLDMVVDYIMFSTYRDVDLTEDPILLPPCGHIQTVSSLDGYMDLASFYQHDDRGHIVGLSGTLRPFDMKDIKSCPTCRGPLRSINRYNRIVKRGLIDEATKRFIVWANDRFVTLERKGHELDTGLARSVSSTTFSAVSRPPQKITQPSEINSVDLSGLPSKVTRTIKSLPETCSRYKDFWQFRMALNNFCREVSFEEQPFRRIWDLCRLFCNNEENQAEIEILASASDTALNFRNSLLAQSLLLHTDASILNDCVEVWLQSRIKSQTLRTLSIDTAGAREECLNLFTEAELQDQPLQQVESLIHFVFFSAAEIRCPKDSQRVEKIRESAFEQLDKAAQIVQDKPSTGVLAPKIESGRKALSGDFQTVVTDEEMRSVYAAMAVTFNGTGHWYRCENGHLFTIGECGMPVEVARCPQCGAQVGGQDHTSVTGVQRAADIEERFG